MAVDQRKMHKQIKKRGRSLYVNILLILGGYTTNLPLLPLGFWYILANMFAVSITSKEVGAKGHMREQSFGGEGRRKNPQVHIGSTEFTGVCEAAWQCYSQK